MNQKNEKNLSTLESFKSMFVVLEEYYKRTHYEYCLCHGNLCC